MTDKIYTVFQRAVLVFLSACFIWTGIGTVGLIARIHIGSGRYNGAVFFFAAFLTILFLLLIYRAFGWIRLYPDSRTQNIISAVLFGCMALFFLIILLCFDANLRNDAYMDADTACFLTDHDHVPEDNKHPGELLSFGNNYFFIFMTSRVRVIKILFGLGITEPVIYLQSINALFMIAGAFFTWLFAREIKGRVFANQVLLLCVFNPLFYGFTFWYYSNSLSIPIMMAIPYVCIKLYRTERLSVRLSLCALMGGLLFLGYQLRPTAIFPFIAALLTAPFVLSGKASFKKIIPQAGVLLLCTLLLFAGFSRVKTSYFGELIPHNRPITYWLAMGAHGTGNLATNGSDIRYVKSLSDDDNKTVLCLKRAMKHYKKNGLIGTADLWARKTQTTWSDGYGGISRRIISGEAKSPLYRYFAGESKDLFVIYCQLFRLITFLGMTLFCFYYFNRRVSGAVFICVITMLGGIVFYFLWEARAFYSAPFVPVMLILAAEGFSEFFEGIREPFSDRNFAICFLLISLFVCADVTVITGQTMSMDHFRIYTKGKVRHYANIEDEGKPVLLIEQDFYSYRPFNRITFAAKLKNDVTSLSGVSKYSISVAGDRGEVYSGIISQKSIGEKGFTIRFKNAAPAGNYSIIIKKLSPEKDDITFQKKYDSYYIDAYRGELKVNGHGGYVNDLGISVLLHTEKEPYLSKKIRFLLAFIILMLSILAVIPIYTRAPGLRARN